MFVRCGGGLLVPGYPKHETAIGSSRYDPAQKYGGFFSFLPHTLLFSSYLRTPHDQCPHSNFLLRSVHSHLPLDGSRSDFEPQLQFGKQK
jgi:hypothetical protein